MTPDSPTMADALDPVIKWLEGGCDPLKAAQELRLIAADRASREAGMPLLGPGDAFFADGKQGYFFDTATAHGSACYAAGLSAGRAESQPAPEGWKLVPTEITAAMIKAWCRVDTFKGGYRAMLAASPSAPVAAQTEQAVEAGLPFEEMERLANQFGDYDASHGGAFIFSADPAARWNVYEFVQACIDAAMSQSGGQP